MTLHRFLLICSLLAVTLLAACSPGAQVATETPPLPTATVPATEEPASPTPPPATPTEAATPAATEPAMPGLQALVPEEFQPQPGDEELLREDVQVEMTEIIALESFPPQYQLLVTGTTPTPCHEPRVTVDDPDAQNRIMIELYAVVEPDIVCAQVLEPFNIQIPLGSYETGEYSVFLNGEQAAQIPPAPPADGDGNGAAALPGDLQDRIAEAVAEEMNVTLEEVTFVSVEQVDWTDSCLGAGGPAESCLQVITPGYRVIVEVNGQQVEVRTDLEGQQIRIV